MVSCSLPMKVRWLCSDLEPVPSLARADETLSIEARRQSQGERAQGSALGNVQARARTKILMDNGFTVGTGDVSELAIGWCTYNGDHMSMYGVNSSVPKTLVKFLVAWASNT